jgi:hypothetical protein
MVFSQMQTFQHNFYLLIKQIYCFCQKDTTCFGWKSRHKAIPYQNINRETYTTLQSPDFFNGKILRVTTFFKIFCIFTMYIPTTTL